MAPCNHYTSLDALTNVISKREMWATHIRYLNDTSEQEILRGAVSSHINKSFILPADVLERWRSKLSDRPEPCFVICFSEDRGDRLSQWRAYGGTSSVCLKFDKFRLYEYCNQKSSDFPSLPKISYVDPTGDAALTANTTLALNTTWASEPRWGQPRPWLS